VEVNAVFTRLKGTYEIPMNQNQKFFGKKEVFSTQRGKLKFKLVLTKFKTSSLDTDAMFPPPAMRMRMNTSVNQKLTHTMMNVIARELRIKGMILTKR